MLPRVPALVEPSSVSSGRRDLRVAHPEPPLEIQRVRIRQLRRRRQQNVSVGSKRRVMLNLARPATNLVKPATFLRIAYCPRLVKETSIVRFPGNRSPHIHPARGGTRVSAGLQHHLVAVTLVACRFVLRDDTILSTLQGQMIRIIRIAAHTRLQLLIIHSAWPAWLPVASAWPPSRLRKSSWCESDRANPASIPRHNLQVSARPAINSPRLYQAYAGPSPVTIPARRYIALSSSAVLCAAICGLLVSSALARLRSRRQVQPHHCVFG